MTKRAEREDILVHEIRDDGLGVDQGHRSDVYGVALGFNLVRQHLGQSFDYSFAVGRTIGMGIIYMTPLAHNRILSVRLNDVARALPKFAEVNQRHARSLWFHSNLLGEEPIHQLVRDSCLNGPLQHSNDLTGFIEIHLGQLTVQCEINPPLFCSRAEKRTDRDVGAGWPGLRPQSNAVHVDNLCAVVGVESVLIVGSFQKRPNGRVYSRWNVKNRVGVSHHLPPTRTSPCSVRRYTRSLNGPLLKVTMGNSPNGCSTWAMSDGGTPAFNASERVSYVRPVRMSIAISPLRFSGLFAASFVAPLACFWPSDDMPALDQPRHLGDLDSLGLSVLTSRKLGNGPGPKVHRTLGSSCRQPFVSQALPRRATDETVEPVNRLPSAVA